MLLRAVRSAREARAARSVRTVREVRAVRASGALRALKHHHVETIPHLRCVLSPLSIMDHWRSSFSKVAS